MSISNFLIFLCLMIVLGVYLNILYVVLGILNCEIKYKEKFLEQVLGNVKNIIVVLFIIYQKSMSINRKNKQGYYKQNLILEF